jgi:hypothetical protein
VGDASICALSLCPGRFSRSILTPKTTTRPPNMATTFEFDNGVKLALDGSTPSVLPSFEDLRRAKKPCYRSKDVDRLYWTLDGPLDKAVSVMCHGYYDTKDPAPKPYCCNQKDTTSTTQTGSWHPISQSSIVEPKVSSVTVHVQCLSYWEDDWDASHIEHVDPFNDPECFGPLPDNYGEDDYDDSEPPPELLRCCGQEVPKGKDVGLTVKAATEGGFVTIHDFVTSVHPWLLSLRGDILQASGDLQDGTPLPADTELMVLVYGDKVNVVTKKEGRNSKARNPFLDEYTPPLADPVDHVYAPDETPVGSVVPGIYTGPLPRLLDSHHWPGS